MCPGTGRQSVIAFATISIIALQAAPGEGQTPIEPVPPPVTTARASPAFTADEGPSRRSNWSRVYISDVYVRDAAQRALQGASEWLEGPRCQTLLSEFRDERQRPLTERLSALEVTVQDYLRLLIFEDGDTHSQCMKPGVLAFTVPGSRVVYLCGSAFARNGRNSAQEARATIVHELLHSLGLGENPPSPRFITQRVQELCW